jgi:hypothetical protein
MRPFCVSGVRISSNAVIPRSHHLREWSVRES